MRLTVTTEQEGPQARGEVFQKGEAYILLIFFTQQPFE